MRPRKSGTGGRGADQTVPWTAQKTMDADTEAHRVPFPTWFHLIFKILKNNNGDLGWSKDNFQFLTFIRILLDPPECLQKILRKSKTVMVARHVAGTMPMCPESLSKKSINGVNSITRWHYIHRDLAGTVGISVQIEKSGQVLMDRTKRPGPLLKNGKWQSNRPKM